MASIATLTLNPAVDKSSQIEQVMPDKKLRCRMPEYHPGGGGLNVARVIKELGGDATAFWTRGGAIGDLLGSLLDAEGVEHQSIPIRRMTRENLIVYEQRSTQQYRFGMPGAELDKEEVEKCMNMLKQLSPTPGYLVLSGSLPPGVQDTLYARIAAAMPEGCRVVLDTNGEPLKHGVRAPLYLIKPNINELSQLAGEPIESDSQICQVARTLIDDARAQIVLASLGSGGAVLTTATQHVHFRAPTVRIQSKVGAGDSTVAGMIYALSEGKSPVEAARFAVAAGAAAVMTSGTELCYRKDVERLADQVTEQTVSDG